MINRTKCFILAFFFNRFWQSLGALMHEASEALHCMGYRPGHEQSRSRPYLYALATLMHSWGTAHPCIDYCRTDWEGEHQTEYNLARHRVGVVATQRQLAAQYTGETNSCSRGDESDETIKTCILLLTWLRPPQAAHASWDRELFASARAPCECESSLLDQRPALRSTRRSSAFHLIAQHGVEHSCPYCLALFWFSCWFYHEKLLTRRNHDKVAHRMTMRWFFCRSEIRLPSVEKKTKKKILACCLQL